MENARSFSPMIWHAWYVSTQSFGGRSPHESKAHAYGCKLRNQALLRFAGLLGRIACYNSIAPLEAYSRTATMYEAVVDECTIRQLTTEEIEQVSGGFINIAIGAAIGAGTYLLYQGITEEA